MRVFALSGRKGCGACRVGALFSSYRTPHLSATVWLEVLFPGGVGDGQFVGEVFKLGVKIPREDVYEIHSE